ncbi:hypothetical protein UPYG_G00052910 [Umbra pygmaea]|uniref:Uncharacterized protein n=1 Tax=Umbra pygmaea TaxID=75934 RepID=A0ABD0XSK4_UMBPY
MNKQELSPHEEPTAKSLQHADQRGQLLISHLLQDTQKTSFEEHLRHRRTLGTCDRTMWPDDSFLSPSCAQPAAVLDPMSLRLMITFPPEDASFHLQAASRSSFTRPPNCIIAT